MTQQETVLLAAFVATCLLVAAFWRLWWLLFGEALVAAVEKTSTARQLRWATWFAMFLWFVSAVTCMVLLAGLLGVRLSSLGQPHASKADCAAEQGPDDSGSQRCANTQPSRTKHGLDLFPHQPGLPLVFTQAVLRAIDWESDLPSSQVFIGQLCDMTPVDGAELVLQGLRGGFCISAV